LNNNRSVVVVNKDLIGAYTVRGVSLSIKDQERVVLLCGSSSGASPLIQSLLGVNMILEGEVAINGWNTEIGKRMINIDYKKLHGIVGYQPQRDSI
jgi:ABC-type polar amino acid transport system ATPase subunit